VGTNYYLHTGNQAEEPRHIGKSSVGWCFSLVSDPVNGPVDLAGWVVAWSAPDVEIRDEYGRILLPFQMHSIVTERQRPQRPNWTTSDYQKNHAVPGPNNLLRHRLGSHCIAHGDGTYDLCPPGFC
jgi:hypothetical protein